MEVIRGGVVRSIGSMNVPQSKWYSAHLLSCGCVRSGKNIWLLTIGEGTTEVGESVIRVGFAHLELFKWNWNLAGLQCFSK